MDALDYTNRLLGRTYDAISGGLSADTVAAVMAVPPATREELFSEALTEARQIAASAKALLFLLRQLRDMDWLPVETWLAYKTECVRMADCAVAMQRALRAAREDAE